MKKKHIIGLGTLLLVLLLGLSTICYADSKRTWEDIEIKNILYRYWRQYNNKTEEQAIQLVNDVESKITQFVNDINNRECIIIKSTSGQLYLVCLTSNIIPYIRSGNRLSFNTYNSDCYYYLCNNSGLNLDKRTNLSDLSSFVYNNDYIYTSMNIKSGSTNGSVLWSAGYYNPSSFFDEWYWTSTMPFTFIAKPSDTYASVWSYDDVPFYNASGEDLYIGQLFVPGGTIMEENNLNFYYRFGTWNHRYLSTNCYYLEFYTNDDDVTVYDVYLSKQFIYENTLYDLTISDKSVEPYNLAPIFFYIRNNYTVICNGVLDTSSTFSGDYKEQYDNEIQNEQDINNISEAIIGTILDDSEVDNILHNFDTSGEVAAYFGYHDYTSDSDSPYYRPSLLITSVVESLIDELMRSGDRYVDITLPNGEQERIWARYFTTPDEGRGSAWILFVRWYLIFVTIYLLYRNLLEIGEQFSTLNIHGAINEIDVDRYVFRM